MAEDPLAEVIEGALNEWWDIPSSLRTTDCRTFLTAAVRARVAAVLDAEEAAWQQGPLHARLTDPQLAIHNLRAALLGTTEETPGG